MAILALLIPQRACDCIIGLLAQEQPRDPVAVNLTFGTEPATAEIASLHSQ
jgi:hypothetical protein